MFRYLCSVTFLAFSVNCFALTDASLAASAIATDDSSTQSGAYELVVSHANSGSAVQPIEMRLIVRENAPTVLTMKSIDGASTARYTFQVNRPHSVSLPIEMQKQGSASLVQIAVRIEGLQSNGSWADAHNATLVTQLGRDVALGRSSRGAADSDAFVVSVAVASADQLAASGRGSTANGEACVADVAKGGGCCFSFTCKGTTYQICNGCVSVNGCPWYCGYCP